MMAIYHLSAKTFSRSNGHSAVAAASYRSAEKLHDERTGKTHDYTRKQRVLHTEIITSASAPSWSTDRERLWNAVETSEKRKDSQVAREIEVALPRELNLSQNTDLVKEFVQKQFVDIGMIADISLHESEAKDGETNPHAHIMLTMREITLEGFGKKNRDWNSKEMLKLWRESWQESVNKHLEDAGEDERIDHRTLEAQGIERTPQIHLGKEASALEKKQIETVRGNDARKIEHYNGVRAYMKIAQDWTREERTTITNRTRDYVATWFDNAKDAIVKKYTNFRDRITSERNEPEPDYER